MRGQPKLILFGPDTRYGASRRKRFREYVWYIRFREGGQPRFVSTGCPRERETEAEEYFARWLLGRNVTPAGPRGPDQVAISEALNWYAVEHAPHVAAPERIGYAIDRLLEFWGDGPISGITANTCRAYARHRASAGAAAGTTRRELVALTAALNHAHKEGRITGAPAVWKPPSPEARDKWITRDEAARLIKAARMLPTARRYLPLYMLIGLYTGARSRAILGLQWFPNTTGGWIDLANGVIRWKASPTSKRRPRVTPMPRQLICILSRRRSRMNLTTNARSVFGDARSLKKSFAASCARASLRGVTPHTMRHTCGTWMAQRAVPIWEIAGYLGMSEATAAKVYLHHHPDHMKRATAALERRSST